MPLYEAARPSINPTVVLSCPLKKQKCGQWKCVKNAYISCLILTVDTRVWPSYSEKSLVPLSSLTVWYLQVVFVTERPMKSIEHLYEAQTLYLHPFVNFRQYWCSDVHEQFIVLKALYTNQFLIVVNMFMTSYSHGTSSHFLPFFSFLSIWHTPATNRVQVWPVSCCKETRESKDNTALLFKGNRH